MDKIWERLKSSFGNVSTLLSAKISKIDASTPLWKVKGDENVVEAIINTKNLMVELSAMSEKHSVEQNLYHSSNISKVFSMLGRNRQLEFTKEMVDDSSVKSEKDTWKDLIKFLDKEVRVKEKMMLFKKSDTKSVDGGKKNDDSAGGSHHPAIDLPPPSKKKNYLECCICGKSDHVSTHTKKGTKIVCYHACQKFVLMTVKERFDLLKSKKLCLYPIFR